MGESSFYLEEGWADNTNDKKLTYVSILVRLGFANRVFWIMKKATDNLWDTESLSVPSEVLSEQWGFPMDKGKLIIHNIFQSKENHSLSPNIKNIIRNVHNSLSIFGPDTNFWDEVNFISYISDIIAVNPDILEETLMAIWKEYVLVDIGQDTSEPEKSSARDLLLDNCEVPKFLN